MNEIMILNQPCLIWELSVYIGAFRTKDGFVLIISDKHTPTLVKDYVRCWEIETLFGCLKSKGFNIALVVAELFYRLFLLSCDHFPIHMMWGIADHIMPKACKIIPFIQTIFALFVAVLW